MIVKTTFQLKLKFINFTLLYFSQNAYKVPKYDQIIVQDSTHNNIQNIKEVDVFTIILKKCTHAFTNIETVIPKSYLI